MLTRLFRSRIRPLQASLHALLPVKARAFTSTAAASSGHPLLDVSPEDQRRDKGRRVLDALREAGLLEHLPPSCYAPASASATATATVPGVPRIPWVSSPDQVGYRNRLRVAVDAEGQVRLPDPEDEAALRRDVSGILSRLGRRARDDPLLLSGVAHLEVLIGSGIGPEEKRRGEKRREGKRREEKSRAQKRREEKRRAEQRREEKRRAKRREEKREERR